VLPQSQSEDKAETSRDARILIEGDYRIIARVASSGKSRNPIIGLTRTWSKLRPCYGYRPAETRANA
jgi:hypothetical protein